MITESGSWASLVQEQSFRRILAFVMTYGSEGAWWNCPNLPSSIGRCRTLSPHLKKKLDHKRPRLNLNVHYRKEHQT